MFSLRLSRLDPGRPEPGLAEWEICVLDGTEKGTRLNDGGIRSGRFAMTLTVLDARTATAHAIEHGDEVASEDSPRRLAH